MQKLVDAMTIWARVGSTFACKEWNICFLNWTCFFAFAAVGCTNIVPPDNAWLKRSNNDIIIGCYSSQQTWQLKCDGRDWIGTVGTCPLLCKPLLALGLFIRSLVNASIIYRLHHCRLPKFDEFLNLVWLCYRFWSDCQRWARETGEEERFGTRWNISDLLLINIIYQYRLTQNLLFVCHTRSILVWWEYSTFGRKLVWLVNCQASCLT